MLTGWNLCESLPPVRTIQCGCILNFCFKSGGWTVSRPIHAASPQSESESLVNLGRQFRGWTAHSPLTQISQNQSKCELLPVTRRHPTQPHHQSTVLSKAHHTSSIKNRAPGPCELRRCTYLFAVSPTFSPSDCQVEEALELSFTGHHEQSRAPNTMNASDWQADKKATSTMVATSLAVHFIFVDGGTFYTRATRVTHYVPPFISTVSPPTLHKVPTGTHNCANRRSCTHGEQSYLLDQSVPKHCSGNSWVLYVTESSVYVHESSTDLRFKISVHNPLQVAPRHNTKNLADHVLRVLLTEAATSSKNAV
jgi:hypothetical protein